MYILRTGLGFEVLYIRLLLTPQQSRFHYVCDLLLTNVLAVKSFNMYHKYPFSKNNCKVLYLLFQTSRSEFEGTEFSVRRRYNDFLWIRERLEEKYPTHLVPVSRLIRSEVHCCAYQLKTQQYYCLQRCLFEWYTYAK